MSAYEPYTLNEGKGYEFIGFLPERRRNPIRITQDSVTNWGKKYFGNKLNLNEMFFIEVEINGESIRPL